MDYCSRSIDFKDVKLIVIIGTFSEAYRDVYRGVFRNLSII